MNLKRIEELRILWLLIKRTMNANKQSLNLEILRPNHGFTQGEQSLVMYQSYQTASGTHRLQAV